MTAPQSETLKAVTVEQMDLIIQALETARAKIVELAEENGRFKMTLQFYADKRNWVFKRIKAKNGGIQEKLCDRGKRARQVLRGVS